MKGRTLVIGIVLFVLLVVGAITFAMMSTINGIKEENGIATASLMLMEESHSNHFIEIR